MNSSAVNYELHGSKSSFQIIHGTIFFFSLFRSFYCCWNAVIYGNNICGNRFTIMKMLFYKRSVFVVYFCYLQSLHLRSPPIALLLSVCCSSNIVVIKLLILMSTHHSHSDWVKQKKLRCKAKNKIELTPTTISRSEISDRLRRYSAARKKLLFFHFVLWIRKFDKVLPLQWHEQTIERWNQWMQCPK